MELAMLADGATFASSPNPNCYNHHQRCIFPWCVFFIFVKCKMGLKKHENKRRAINYNITTMIIFITDFEMDHYQFSTTITIIVKDVNFLIILVNMMTMVTMFRMTMTREAGGESEKFSSCVEDGLVVSQVRITYDDGDNGDDDDEDDNDDDNDDDGDGDLGRV